jgi:hypothetical protein
VKIIEVHVGLQRTAAEMRKDLRLKAWEPSILGIPNTQALTGKERTWD